MTVIAGCTNGSTWAIGADSGVFEGGDFDGDSDSGLYWQADKPKVWRREHSLIGASGNSAVCDLAESCPSGDPYKIAAFMKAREGSDSVVGKSWNVLVVRQEAVYYIGEDCDVHKMKRGYMAIGAAGQIALGALAVEYADIVDVKQAVRVAVKASIDNHIYAVGPVVVKVLHERD